MKRFIKFSLMGAGGFVALIWALILFGDPNESERPRPEIAVTAPVEVDEAIPALPTKAEQTGEFAPASSREMDQIDHRIAATINLSGNLCARPIEVREAGDGLYGVRCVTNRNGTGISDYIINARTNEVMPI